MVERLFRLTLSADYFALRGSSAKSGLVGAFFPDGGFALAGPDGPELVEGGFVTTGLLEVLRVAPRLAEGSPLNRKPVKS